MQHRVKVRVKVRGACDITNERIRFEIYIYIYIYI